LFTVGLVVSSSTLAGGTVMLKSDAEPKLLNADAAHRIDLSDRNRERAARSAPRATASLSPDLTSKAEQAGVAARENVKRRIAQEKAAAEARAKAEAARKQAEARKRAAEQAAREAARKRAAAKAALAASYRLPLSDYRLTASYGQSGSRWSSGYHTGLDFAASTGTPVRAVHSGTILEAGYSGAYGNRIKLELDDGTVIYYCHLSSFASSSGEEVGTGEVIGYVGATGNVTGPHLHLEVRPGGGDPIDPADWLRDKGLNP
jgi:murein DD-endopeptidase MepM/ murein hydrolase activator NlpD